MDIIIDSVYSDIEQYVRSISNLRRDMSPWEVSNWTEWVKRLIKQRFNFDVDLKIEKSYYVFYVTLDDRTFTI
jgi:hypothetical protein